jgi:hypothetical protein
MAFMLRGSGDLKSLLDSDRISGKSNYENVARVYDRLASVNARLNNLDLAPEGF